MLESLPGFLQAWWMYLAGAALVCAVACYFSVRLRGGLKKGLLLVLVIFGLIAGYELVTGKNIFRLPGEVDRELSKRPEHPETGRRYYVSPEERYGRDPGGE